MTLYAVINIQILYFLLNILYYLWKTFLNILLIFRLELQPLNVTIIFFILKCTSMVIYRETNICIYLYFVFLSL